MLLRMQWRRTSGVVWLPCLSKMSNRVRPSAFSQVCGSKLCFNHFFICSLLVQPQLLTEKSQSFGTFSGSHRPVHVFPLKIISGGREVLSIQIHLMTDTHSCRPGFPE